MTRRIALWSFVGLIVACGWVLFWKLTFPLNHSSPAFWTIQYITAPASLLRYIPFPIKYYSFVLLNALAYSLVGVGVELLRRHSLRPTSVP